MAYCESKYAKVAVEAADVASKGINPVTAWVSVAAKVFLGSPSGERKNCPKSAFLGLAESGEIVGIGPGKYTKSTDNKRYAEMALQLLRANESWSKCPSALWLRVMKRSNKKHNSQMEVVIALWHSNKFVGQRRLTFHLMQTYATL